MLLVLWLTTGCNLRCHYCYACGGESRMDMEWSVAQHALEIALQAGGPCHIQFAGGEPLLRPDLIEQIVRHTAGHGIRYQLQTNGTLIDRSAARWLKRLGVAIGVSLDGEPRINDRLRPHADGRGSTAEVMAGLQALASEGLQTGLTCVLSAASAPGLPDLVDIASYLGNVPGIALDVLCPWGRACEGAVSPASPLAAAQGLQAALCRADYLADLGARRVHFRELERLRHVLARGQRPEHHCQFGAGSSLMVTPIGHCYPCASLAGEPRFCLGNVQEKGFEKVWAARLQEAWHRIPGRRACAGCPEHSVCDGGCAAQSLAADSGWAAIECVVRRVCHDHLRCTTRA